MSELRIRRETEEKNDLQELRTLLDNLNLDMKDHRLDRSKADNKVVNRLEMRKPAIRPGETVNIKEFDEKKYLQELKTDLRECNPNYKLGKEWRINCQRCVPAFEMRRRGLDVTAKSRTKGFDTLAYNPFQVWKNPEVIKARGNGLDDIEKNMVKWGDGARAQVVLMWNNAPSGHTFFAERVNGKTRFYDPQNGSMDVTKYFERARPGTVSFCRVDNLEPSDKIKECYRVRV